MADATGNALDRQGSSVALINADGAKSGTYRYTPYGEVKDVDGTTADAIDINFYRHTLGFTDAGEGTGFVKHGVRFTYTLDHEEPPDTARSPCWSSRSSRTRTRKPRL